MTLRILYVDDEADLREIAAMSLELDPALEVRTCADGREALDVAAAWQPDLVLLDMMMPGMDGPATHEALRERHGDSLPVVYITARAQKAEIDYLTRLGAIGVIAKPFDPMTLAQDVRRLLGHG